MEYTVGSVGRVVVARLFEGEDLHESIGLIARKEGIHCAAVLITGGFRSANVVVGPRQEEPKIEPRFQVFAGPGEVLGVGTLFWNNMSRSCTSTRPSAKTAKASSAARATTPARS